jgi:hypothetical protein
MNAFEPIGYLAALFVLATFCMRDMVALRVMAIASNVAFIAYGALADIGPVLMLHVVLLPVNVLRLVQAARSEPQGLAETAWLRAGPPRAQRGSVDRRRRTDRRVAAAVPMRVVSKRASDDRLEPHPLDDRGEPQGADVRTAARHHPLRHHAGR